jgi:hypothetical protein
MMREKRGEGVRENEREREKVLEGVGRKRQASRVDEEREWRLEGSNRTSKLNVEIRVECLAR